MENYCKALGTNQEPIDVVNKLFKEGKDGRAVYGPEGGFIPS